MNKQATVTPPLERPLEAFGPELAQLLVVGMWASTFIVTKHAFDEVTPMAFIFVRFVMMLALAFGVLAAGRRKGAWRIRRADLPRFLLVGLAGYTLYQLGFVLGLDNTSPFSSSLLIAMVPFYTMVFLTLRGERSPGRAWLGLLVGVAGVALFMWDKQGSPGSLLGDLLSIGASISFAIYGIINRPLVKSYPTQTYSAYTLLAGSIPLLLLSTPAAIDQNWMRVSFWGWVEIVYMVILPVYVAYMLWNWAIARRGATAASSFSLLVPVLAGILSAIFTQEAFGPTKLAGAALVLGGLVVLRTATTLRSGRQ